MSIERAELSDGRIAEYVMTPDPPGGAMTYTYFAPDRSYVVHFYRDAALQKDPGRRKRTEMLTGKFNPTLDPILGDYWRKLFWWPSGAVVKPKLGMVCPTCRPNFLFSDGPFKGKQKDAYLFVLEKPRRMLTDKDRGTWLNYLQICILLARAVRRLHQAGLAHADLSPHNILIDPPSAGCMIFIDIDALVVPGICLPQVMGTPGYMAPELFQNLTMPINDPRRANPSSATDAHALAVLIYQFLLQRNPLRGPKVHSQTSTEEDDRLAMGEKALFIEDPNDTSNRPKDLKISYEALGPHLSPLVRRAFVDGLHHPAFRPAAIEWERALCHTWDLKVDCSNPRCPAKGFIFNRASPVCPFCGERLSGTFPILKLRRQGQAGQGRMAREVVVQHNHQLFEWHALDNKSPDEGANRKRLAYCSFHQGQWLLVNEGLPTLTSPAGNRVPIGQALALTHGAVFRFSADSHSYLAEVDLVNCNSAAP
jgi:hypothetical protein